MSQRNVMTIEDANGVHHIVSSEAGSYGIPVDEHGKPVSRTKTSHPYSYDGFVVYRGGPNSEITGTAYDDRMVSWDREKFHRLNKQHFPSQYNDWSQRPPKQVEAFLRDYFDEPELKLILIMEYCHQASGFPVWRFDYATPKKEKKDV